jgi:anti-sigma factor ChrR (cupin superfamily)
MHPNDTVINDYVDEELDPRERAGVEQHLQSCARCRSLVDDLREIQSVAKSLDLREPPVRSWTRLERAIRLEKTPAQQRRTAPYLWLGAAAAIVLATVVGMRIAPRGADTRVPATPTAPADSAQAVEPSAQLVESELREAEDHYEKAIKGLEQIANAEQNVFDPHTAATLQKNLAVIDQAISESRAALRSQPTSEPAQQSLLENFQAKVALLQDTVSLINEMRKGNEAGAARIVSGLKQRGN